MIKHFYPFALGLVMFHVGLAGVVQKYQSSSCQDLQQKKSQPATGGREMMEEKVVEMLRKDPQMRTEFLNRVAGPIANKMFECGMIP